MLPLQFPQSTYCQYPVCCCCFSSIICLLTAFYYPSSFISLFTIIYFIITFHFLSLLLFHHSSVLVSHMPPDYFSSLFYPHQLYISQLLIHQFSVFINNQSSLQTTFSSFFCLPHLFMFFYCFFITLLSSSIIYLPTSLSSPFCLINLSTFHFFSIFISHLSSTITFLH